MAEYQPSNFHNAARCRHDLPCNRDVEKII